MEGTITVTLDAQETTSALKAFYHYVEWLKGQPPTPEAVSDVAALYRLTSRIRPDISRQASNERKRERDGRN